MIKDSEQILNQKIFNIKQLCCAVIKNAFEEATTNRVSYYFAYSKKDAENFIMSDRIEKFCEDWELDVNLYMLRKELQKRLNQKRGKNEPEHNQESV